jgi:hypothetical protein
LKDLVALFDSRLEGVQQAIESSADPDAFGLFDEAEYIAGMGFTAFQRYICSTYGPLDIEKHLALEAGPRHAGGEPIARIINAVANYWKHSDEWNLHSVVTRSRSGLSHAQLETIRVIETVTPWDDYTCANLLSALASPSEPRLTCLLPQLEGWRNALDIEYVNGF